MTRRVLTITSHILLTLTGAAVLAAAWDTQHWPQWAVTALVLLTAAGVTGNTATK